MPTLDHITLTVSDYARAKAFYQKALAPLGIQLVLESGESAGFCRTRTSEFWTVSRPSSIQEREHVRLITPTHVAFAAESRAEVDAFHVAALAAGGSDYGGPGVRAHYHPDYYAAFVLDPDGHDIEAVFHGG